MRGVYTVTYHISDLDVEKTLILLSAPADKVVEVLSASVTNDDNAVNEQFQCTLQRVQTLGSPTGTSATPAKHEEGDQSAGSTVLANITASEPTYAANTEIGREATSSVGGWYFDPTPEERPTVKPSGTIGLRHLGTLGTGFGAVIRVTFREIG